MELQYKVIEGERRNSKLYIQNKSAFIKRSESNGVIYLRCKNHMKNCKVSGILKVGDVKIIEKGEHTCSLSEENIDIINLK